MMIALHFAAILAVYLIACALIAWSMAKSTRAENKDDKPDDKPKERITYEDIRHAMMTDQEFLRQAMEFDRKWRAKEARERAESGDNATSETSEGQGGGCER